MIQNEELRTSGRQRVAIVVIALLMLFSTFALYAGIMIGNKGSSSGADEEKTARFNELYAKYIAALDEQGSKLSDKYFDDFSSYKSRVKAFNSADITKLEKKDLKVGDGAEVTDENFTAYSAYYIGWLSDETIFDSSFDNADKPTALKTPLAGSNNMIQGWIEGIVGMKIGGVRELSIPSALAYGDQAQDKIPANSPLKFVIMLLDPVEEPDFEGSEELEQLTNELYGA
ncbi:FKBP-type peptidyl-prolyl cis-trans isomerase [Candidatus Saccharibacteria bacterium]|nr:FKBP-type peptidyl-prolyl cis-trans isomerase [Candidatus Saccharibacteria bacterium]